MKRLGNKVEVELNYPTIFILSEMNGGVKVRG